jgi:hypothetical protein
MERSRKVTLTASVALAVVSANGAMAFAESAGVLRTAQAGQSDQAAPAAQTGQTAPQTAPSPMIKPPASASGSGGSNNPDNMPIKRPPEATHDRMMHEPPASGAQAK